MAFASGEVAGVTWMTSVPARGGERRHAGHVGHLGQAGLQRAAARLGPPPSGSAPPAAAGPLKPGPKPSASRSYAVPGGGRRRVVALVRGAEPKAEHRDGEHPTITAAAVTAKTAGLRSTVPDQRAHSPAGTGGGSPGGRSARRCRRLSTRIPNTPSSAGSRVTAASTVNTTVSAEAIARPFRKLTPRTRMPSSAMHTVLPANRTARPEVSMALTAASSGVSPGLQAAAVPGHDEKRVVDAHAEADQGAEDRREVDHDSWHGSAA